jgi:hypothetical protein
MPVRPVWLDYDLSHIDCSRRQLSQLLPTVMPTLTTRSLTPPIRSGSLRGRIDTVDDIPASPSAPRPQSSKARRGGEKSPRAGTQRAAASGTASAAAAAGTAAAGTAAAAAGEGAKQRRSRIPHTTEAFDRMSVRALRTHTSPARRRPADQRAEEAACGLQKIFHVESVPR